MTLDGSPEAATPETRRVATASPLWRRFAAWIADWALAFSPVGLVYVATDPGGLRDALELFALIATIVIAIANDIMLVARTGQSIGRKLCGIIVLDSRTMLPPLTEQAFLRCVLGTGAGGLVAALWLPICFIPAFIDRQWHRGLNDRWAHTVVIDLLADQHR